MEPELWHTQAYPEAYQQMSAERFAGNFLALVARGDELDKPLIEAVEEGWERSMKQKREQGGVPANYTRTEKLISFVHDPSNPTNQIVEHFLQSDQQSFWNHHVRTQPNYPAVLLTDTRCNFLL